MRICGDYKVTVNPALDVNQYPLPRPEDLFATLASGKQFTTLDLSHAYNQLVLEDSSRTFLTINTHVDSISMPDCRLVLRLHQQFFRKLWTQYYRVCRE